MLRTQCPPGKGFQPNMPLLVREKISAVNSELEGDEEGAPIKQATRIANVFPSLGDSRFEL